MNPIGVLLYQTNNLVILRSECPTLQNIGLACDANVDV